MTLAVTSRPKVWFLEDKEGVAAWGHLGSKRETASLDGWDRDKRAVAFFFFLTRHSLYFTKLVARNLTGHKRSHSSVKGARKKTLRHDESSPCFPLLLYLNPAQPISLTCSSIFSSAHFTYPRRKHSCRSSYYACFVSSSPPKSFIVMKLQVVMMPSLEGYKVSLS